MATTLADLGFNIDSRPLSTATRELNRMSKGAGMADKSVRGLAGASNLARTAITALGAAVGGLGIARVVSEFATFEQGMRNVAAVAGATNEELAMLSRTALEAAAATRFNPGQTTQALYALASSGQSASEQIASLTNVLNLAEAGQADLGRATELTTSTLNQFGLSASESQRVADVFVASIGASALNVNRLQVAFRNAGPTASALNQSLEATTATIGMLTTAFGNGERAGTGFRAILNELPAQADALGVTIRDANGQFRPFADILADIEANGITAGQAVEMFGAEAGPSLAALLRNGSQALRDMEAGIASTGQAADTAAAQLDTLRGDLDALASSVSVAFIGMGQSQSGILRSTVQTTTDLVRLWSGYGDVIDETNASYSAALTGITAVGGAAVAVTGAFVGLRVATGALTVAQMALNAAMRVNPLIAAATAAVALGGALFAVRNRTVELGGTTATVGDFIRAAWQEISATVGMASDLAGSAWEGFYQWFSQGTSDTVSGMASAWSSIAQFVRNAANQGIGIFITFGETMGIVAGAVVTSFQGAFQNVLNIGRGFWESLQAVFTGDMSFTAFREALNAGLIDPLKDAAADISESFRRNMGRDFIGEAVQIVSDGFGGFTLRVRESAAEMAAARGEAETLGDKLKELTTTTDSVGEAAAKAGQKFDADWIQSLRDAINPMEAFERQAAKIRAAFDAGLLPGITSEQVENYIDSIRPVADESASIWETAFERANERIASGLQEAIASGNWQRIGQTIGGALAGAMSEVVSKTLSDSLSSAGGNLGAFAGPAGAIGGAVVGGLIGGMFAGSTTRITQQIEVAIQGGIASAFESVRIRRDSAFGSSTRRFNLEVSRAVEASIANALDSSTADLAASLGVLGVDVRAAVDSFDAELRGKSVGEVIEQGAERFAVHASAAIALFRRGGEDLGQTAARLAEVAGAAINAARIAGVDLSGLIADTATRFVAETQAEIDAVRAQMAALDQAISDTLGSAAGGPSAAIDAINSLREMSQQSERLAENLAELEAQLADAGVAATGIVTSGLVDTVRELLGVTDAAAVSETQRLTQALDDLIFTEMQQAERQAQDARVALGAFADVIGDASSVDGMIDALRRFDAATEEQIARQLVAAGHVQSLSEALDTMSRAAERAADEARRLAEDTARGGFDLLSRSIRAENERINAQRDSLLSAERERFDTVMDSINAERDARLSANRDSIDMMRDLVRSIGAEVGGVQSALTGLLGQVIPATMRQRALQTLRGALATGDLTGAGQAAGVAASIDTAGFGSSVDFAREQARTAILLGQVADMGAGQLTEAERQLEALENQTETLTSAFDAQIAAARSGHQNTVDSINRNAQSQTDANNALLDNGRSMLNALLGIDDRVLSVADALAEFNAAMGGTQLDIITGVETVAERVAKEEAAKPSAPQSTADVVGSIGGVTTPSVISGMSLSEAKAERARIEREMQKLGQQVASAERQLRVPSTGVAGVARDRQARIALGEAQRAMQEALQQFNDLDNAIRQMQSVPGFANGGMHGGGARIVGERGMEIETTGPARYYSNAETAKMLDNRVLVDEVKQMRQELTSVSRSTADSSRIVADILRRWNIEGTPEEREQTV